MKKNLLLGIFTLVAGSLLAADSSPIGTVTNAAAALGGAANYSWHSTIEAAGGGFGAGTADGKTEKNGYTWVSTERGGNTTVALLKGTNGAVNTPDNGWQSLAEMTAANAGGGGFNPARGLLNYKTPDQQAATLATQATALTAGPNGISGALTEDGAKEMLAFGRPGAAGAAAPTVANPKGSVTFWVTDGKLVKYQFHVSGTVSFNGNDRDVDRTTTVEIKDVGTTKIEAPDAAKAKLQ